MRILVIDDHALFRIGLSELLERRGIDVVAAVSGCEEGLQRVVESRPDAVLLDMRMPEMSGIDVLKRLREDHPQMPITLLTTSQDEQDVLNSLQYGANGYLLKDMEPDELIDALREIVDGGTVISKELTAVLARAAVRQDEEELPEKIEHDHFSELTPREREILCHLAEGKSNKVIARDLGISDGTVKLHVKAILRKLEVHSRVEAAVMAVKHSACEPE